ncbi:MAG: suppressor of fused domain protein [Myxococcales bacterium]|nr:suppressor of fused domain protein [Myxococcales bacterium]MCB9581415.1 suppressor of fused domain protein [Polyangiaceae bacterium]
MLGSRRTNKKMQEGFVGPARKELVAGSASQARDWTTLATSGMSNEPMRLPSHVPQELRRVELMFYLSARRSLQRRTSTTSAGSGRDATPA